MAVACLALVALTACAGALSDADPYTLVPDPGPCEGAFPRYYYDPTTRMCREFIWGGCRGVVPFETLEDCIAGAPVVDEDADKDAQVAPKANESPAEQVLSSDPEEAVKVTNDNVDLS